MIEVKNLSKKYGSKPAISDVSCVFLKDEVTVILGPSGSGKTTLIRCINFLDTPSSGEILFEGKKLNLKNISKFRKKIGMVFQSFNLFPHMNVLDNIIYAPSKLTKKSREELEIDASNLLKKLGLNGKENFMPSRLSGGQKQRVAIARCLILNPEIIIFDEPTSALDPESIKDIVSIIEDIKSNITVIVVTHHLSFAKKIADRIIFMDKGQILCNQESKTFFDAPASIRAKMFLDSVGEYL